MDALSGDVLGHEREDLHRRAGTANLFFDVCVARIVFPRKIAADSNRHFRIIIPYAMPRNRALQCLVDIGEKRGGLRLNASGLALARAGDVEDERTT